MRNVNQIAVVAVFGLGLTLPAYSAANSLARFQDEIDACAAKGGGKVTVSAGLHETAPLELKSNVELHLEDGAELLFTDDLAYYGYREWTNGTGVVESSVKSLVTSLNATNVAITGRGTLRPRMGRWECWRWFKNRHRPRFLELKKTRGIRLEGFRLRHSPSWFVHLEECADVVIRRLDIEGYVNNNDGIDVDSTKDVLIEDCRLSVGDDIICMKSGKDEAGRRRGVPTENVLVRRCTADCGHAFLGIGSECSGGIRNVTMEDCEMEGTCAWLLRLKTRPSRGGFMENITMRNVRAKFVTDTAVQITNGYGGSSDGTVVPPTRVDGVRVENVTVREAKKAFFIDPSLNAQNVVFRNFAVNGAQAETSAPADETSLWQGRIDAAAVVGGRVVVPAGRHLVGQIDLRSNVELRLEKGAVLEGKVGLENYRVTTLPYSEGTWSAVVSAIGVTNVAITGEGEIFGNGTAWPQPEDYGGNQEGRRPRGVFFANCKDVRLSDFTLRDSACWGVVFKCCENVDVRRLKIDNHANANNDGIDLEAKNVVIADCDIDAGDDGVCLKSNTPDFVVENVLVSNVTARSHCNALKLGTASHGTMRNVLFVDCRTEAPRRDFIDHRFGRNRRWYEGSPERIERAPGARLNEPSGISAICVENVDGGVVENVTYRNIVANGSRSPIFVRAGTRAGRSCGTPPSDKYVFRNVRIENVTGTALSGLASSISGVPGCRLVGMTLRNVRIRCRGLGETTAERTRPVPEAAGRYPDAHMFGCMLPAYGLYVRHVDGFRMENVVFELEEGTFDKRDPIDFDDVPSAVISLNDGWTADGVPVTLPYCWNAEDGTDGRAWRFRNMAQVIRRGPSA